MRVNIPNVLSNISFHLIESIIPMSYVVYVGPKEKILNANFVSRSM